LSQHNGGLSAKRVWLRLGAAEARCGIPSSLTMELPCGSPTTPQFSDRSAARLQPRRISALQEKFYDTAAASKYNGSSISPRPPQSMTAAPSSATTPQYNRSSTTQVYKTAAAFRYSGDLTTSTVLQHNSNSTVALHCGNSTAAALQQLIYGGCFTAKRLLRSAVEALQHSGSSTL
jgi:hypothetical protein